MDKKKVTLTFKDWDYTCGDGCCYEADMELLVNGESITQYAWGTEELLKNILEHLGYEVEIKYEDEEK